MAAGFFVCYFSFKWQTVLIRSCRKMKIRNFGSYALPPTDLRSGFTTPEAAPAMPVGS